MGQVLAHNFEAVLAVAVNLAREVIFPKNMPGYNNILRHSTPEHARSLTNACANNSGRTFVAPKSAYGKWDI